MSDFELVGLNEAGPQLLAPTSSDRAVLVGDLLTQTLLIAGGMITDSTGAISFVNENLSTTGTWATGAVTIATSSKSIDINATNTTGEAITIDTPTNNVIGLFNNSHATAPNGFRIDFTDASPDNNTQTFFTFQDSTTQRCFIHSDGDLANHDGIYGMISDRKLKTEITKDGDIRSYRDDIMAVKVRKWRDKSDIELYGPECSPRIGYIHDEIKVIFPGLAPESADMEDVVTGKESVLRMKIIKGRQVPDLDDKDNEQFDEIDIIEPRQIADKNGNLSFTGWVKNNIIEGPILLHDHQQLIREVEELRLRLETLEKA